MRRQNENGSQAGYRDQHGRDVGGILSDQMDTNSYNSAGFNAVLSQGRQHGSTVKDGTVLTSVGEQEDALNQNSVEQHQVPMHLSQ